MAFGKFPQFTIVKTLNSSGTDEKIAAFTPDEDIELKYIYIYLLREGTEGGSETFQLKVYSNSAYTALVDSSDVVTYSTIKGGNNKHRIPFAFNRKMLQGGTTYYLEIVTTNYTRNGDTFYFGVLNETDPNYLTNGDTAVAGCAITHWLGYK